MSKSLSQRATNQDGFIKPGELIELRNHHALTLHDRRLLNELIQYAWPEINEDIDHRVPIWRLRPPTHKGGERVKDSVLRLMQTVVEMKTTDSSGNPATLLTTLLASTVTTDDEANQTGEIAFTFSKHMRSILLDSEYWGRLKGFIIFAFTSKYALCLYEALCLRANRRHTHEDFSVEGFRQLLGVSPDNYKEFKNLKLRVLEPAVTEVSGLSDFNAEIIPIREGGQQRGKLTGFRLVWGRKSQAEWKKTIAELDRHSSGRKARLTGRVEVIASERIPGDTVGSINERRALLRAEKQSS